ncbi:hypothetical protein [Pseudomonas sp. DSP3-2-2]|uniref:hypothetical protein n=1 Tax=unclassified Pseudomonas TaxID=196821 RepID=UPI003CFA6C49
MNINSAVSVSSVYPLVQNRKIDVERPALAAGKLGDIKALDADAAPEALDTADKIELYEYQEKPWMTYEEYDATLSESNNEALYMIMICLDSIKHLRGLQLKFEQFTDHVKDLRPDIASVEFSFTLDENAKIKILASPVELSEVDIDWLTKEINNFDDLRATAHAHSKTLMAMIDHFEPYKGKYTLNRYNFQSTLFYGDNLRVPWGDLQRNFLQKLTHYVEKKPQTLLDTYA